MTVSAGNQALAVPLTIACVATVAVLVSAEWRLRPRQKRISKTLASSCFIGVALCFFERASHAEYGWILAGLVLGAAGDIALLFSGQVAFLAGLIAFLAGHIAYVVAFAL